MKPKFIYNPGKVETAPKGAYGKRVQVITRDGVNFTLILPARNYYWGNDGNYYNIIAYRIIEDKS